jgi:WXG100 family type VII secretion target
MAGEIRINYQEMRAVASDFQQQSESAQQIIQSLNSRTQQLMAGWEGVAEQAFMQELDSCNQRLRRVPEMLQQISQALRNTANRIEQAEEEARRGMSSTITADN